MSKATAAEGDEHAMDGARKGLEGFIACFEKAHFTIKVPMPF